MCYFSHFICIVGDITYKLLKSTNFAGVFEEMVGIKEKKACVLQCCLKDSCNVVFIVDEKCYHIKCNSNQQCIPMLSPSMENADHVSMVLIKPLLEQESWTDILDEGTLRLYYSYNTGHNNF